MVESFAFELMADKGETIFKANLSAVRMATQIEAIFVFRSNICQFGSMYKGYFEGITPGFEAEHGLFGVIIERVVSACHQDLLVILDNFN